MNNDRAFGHQAGTSNVTGSVDANAGVELLILAISTSHVAEVDPFSIDREIRRLRGVTRVFENFSAEAVVVEYLPDQKTKQ